MAEHEIEVRHFQHPHPDYPDTYVALCSCRRWRSKHYAEHGYAEDAGMAHKVRGDQHNRAAAQFEHSGRVSLATQLKWYETQAADPTNPEKEREQWTLLADDLRKRVVAPSDEGQDTLW